MAVKWYEALGCEMWLQCFTSGNRLNVEQIQLNDNSIDFFHAIISEPKENINEPVTKYRLNMYL